MSLSTDYGKDSRETSNVQHNASSSRAATFKLYKGYEVRNGHKWETLPESGYGSKNLHWVYIRTRQGDEEYGIEIAWQDGKPVIKAWNVNEEAPHDFMGQIDLRSEFVFQQLARMGK